MKMIKPIFRALAFVLFAFVVSSCATGSPNIKDGRYTSPLGNFSLPVPSGLGMKVDEAGDNLGGYVSFHDDFGSLSAITYLRLPPDFAEVFGDPARRDHAYSSYLHEHILPGMFEPAFPNTKVLHEEFLGRDEDREFFAVVDLPEGSAMVDVRTGKRFDSTRALLIFEVAGSMYALHDELRGLFSSFAEFSLDEESLESARGSLHRFKETIEFR